MTSRRDRGPGRPRRLAEQQVLDAALEVVRERGAGGLSMRAVARRLGVPTMTVYGYVPNKQALDALVVDHILSQVQVPNSGTWEQRLHGLLCSARRALVEQPQLTDGSTFEGNAIGLLLHGELGHEATRLADEVLSLLGEGSFASNDLHICFSTLFTFVTGYAGTPGSDLGVPDQAGDIDAPSSSEETFGRGLTAVIEGLKVTLAIRTTTPST